MFSHWIVSFEHRKRKTYVRKFYFYFLVHYFSPVPKPSKQGKQNLNLGNFTKPNKILRLLEIGEIKNRNGTPKTLKTEGKIDVGYKKKSFCLATLELFFGFPLLQRFDLPRKDLWERPTRFEISLV